MKYHFILALSVVTGLISCLDHKEDREYYENLEGFQLLYSWGEHSDYYKRHIIDYFGMVALGSEYGTDIPLLRRWSQPMRIFIDGYPEEFHVIEVRRVINDIKKLVHESFNIELVDKQENANMYVFFGSQKDYLRHFPDAAKYLNDNDGFFLTYHDEAFNIHSGHVFVNLERNHRKIQSHIIREEITQALGLGNDIPYYANSIFYESPSDVTSYSNLDEEIIRLLYHPNLVPGLGQKSVESILKNLLGVN